MSNIRTTIDVQMRSQCATHISLSTLLFARTKIKKHRKSLDDFIFNNRWRTQEAKIEENEAKNGNEKLLRMEKFNRWKIVRSSGRRIQHFYNGRREDSRKSRWTTVEWERTNEEKEKVSISVNKLSGIEAVTKSFSIPFITLDYWILMWHRWNSWMKNYLVEWTKAPQRNNRSTIVDVAKDGGKRGIFSKLFRFSISIRRSRGFWVLRFLFVKLVEMIRVCSAWQKPFLLLRWTFPPCDQFHFMIILTFFWCRKQRN